MSTATRLKEYLDYKNIAVSKAEKECGIGPSGLSKQLPSKGFPDGKSIGSDNLEKILSRFTDLSADWLLRGVGDMLKGKAGELETKIAMVSRNKEHKEQAYDILLGLFEAMGKTYDFFEKKGE